MNGATIVFDLDGTLVDTAPDLVGAMSHVLAGLGEPPADPEIARPWISFGARRMIVEVTHARGLTLPDPDIDRLLAEFLVHYEANIARESRPFAGVEALLDELNARGCRLAICTNKREALSVRLLDELALRHRFHALVGRDTLPVHKPDPRHLTEAIARAGGEPARAVMIGDSRTDIDTARAAGVPVIGMSFGYTDIPIRDLAPDRTADHYDEVLAHIEALVLRDE